MSKRAAHAPCEEAEPLASFSSAGPKRRRKGDDEEKEAKSVEGGNGDVNEEVKNGGKENDNGDNNEKFCSACETKTSDWFDNPAVCEGCKKDFGCAECCIDEGRFCDECNIYKCDKCPKPVQLCEHCDKDYCDDCGDFQKTIDPSVEICANCAKKKVSKCEVCHKEVPKMRIAVCASCGEENGSCQECAIGEEGEICCLCDEFFCDDCYQFCCECEQAYCRECGDTRIVGGIPVCSRCRPGGCFCSSCGEKITRSERCIDCGALKCLCGSNCDCESSLPEEDHSSEKKSSASEPSEEEEEESSEEEEEEPSEEEGEPSEEEEEPSEEEEEPSEEEEEPSEEEASEEE